MTRPLPELIEVACMACNGEGGWDDEQGPLMCFTCRGSGKVEACAVCEEVPTVIAGNEACGCTFEGAFQHPEVLWAISAGLRSPEQVGM